MSQDNAALDPENRAIYSEILRAPPGYGLDAAVATTYSLDFETALVIPATLAFQAAESRQQVLDTPLALLEGLERLAGRIVIFCEAGRIKALPTQASRLTALLEDTITEVLAPAGGAFHPKLWALRFTTLQGDGPPLLRLALLSRNLTTDRSWDLSLCLDGAPGPRPEPGNAPIAELLRRLPDLASGRTTPPRARAIAATLADDIDRAIWTLPAAMREISFAVNGLGSAVWRPRVGRKLGIISPFLSADALEILSRGLAPEDARLLSCSEELALLPEATLARFGQVTVLDEIAETEDGEDTTQPAVRGTPAVGLHAKAFVTERYSTTEITLGSGNATAAALLSGANLEVFATLSGPSRLIGTVEDQLAPERLGRFLRPFQPFPATETPAEAAAELAAEARLDSGRKALVRCDPVLRCKVDFDGLIELTLTSARSAPLPQGVSLTLWPLAIGAMHGITLSGGLTRGTHGLGRIALRDVTRWLGVRLEDSATGKEQIFSLGTSLRDLPETRSAEILRTIVENREAFLRYIRLLLGDTTEAAKAIFAMSKGGAFFGMAGFAEDAPILEDMVRALSGDGRQLGDIARLISRLRDAKDAKGDSVIPERFVTLWQVFEQALPKGKHRG
ncbi:MAG: phospholipase D family protein [Cypionkella sp.]|uniref:phospholipase D family protein n=1 Tax=Cypionkella sp. TaxID=2811411 RepID=UPI002ABCBDF0|nr:phospholipase D family protein [Cypionkella sp.]MDZ4312061.1 phospholipase D family protein [Cypionkella sp.]